MIKSALFIKISSCIAVCAVTLTVTARSDLSDAEEVRVKAVTELTAKFDQPEPFENRTAGAATSLSAADLNAFSRPQPNLSFSGLEQFSIGNALFRKLWVSSPSTTLASDGLGPLFNARACQACHIKDGRGHLPNHDSNSGSFVVRLGRKDAATNKWVADPIYGEQVQTAAVPGLIAEARIRISNELVRTKLASGGSVDLSSPLIQLNDLAYGKIHPNTHYSARVAPSMIGMGLLEAIAEDDLIALEDINDDDGNGISGRRAIVRYRGETLTGRFGYKSSSATVQQQVENAFSADMGLSTEAKSSHSGDCTDQQAQCLGMPNGEQAHLGNGEVPNNLLDLVTFYSSNLAPPLRRDVGAENVLAGKKLFYQSGCVDCHQPKFVTSKNATAEQHQFQLIWPYTDLLLHDMGDGLADNLGDNSGASGREWRTAPLWGIGLTQLVNPKATFLHDGRAKTLLEAVLWHGGEAQQAKEQVVNMTNLERDRLIDFLESL